MKNVFCFQLADFQIPKCSFINYIYIYLGLQEKTSIMIINISAKIFSQKLPTDLDVMISVQRR